MHNVSPHSHSEMINSNERYRGRLPVAVSSHTAVTAPRVHLTYDPNPAPSAPVSFSTSNIRIARNAARLRALTAASYRHDNSIESNGPDISALDIGQLGGDIMNASTNANSRPRDAISSSNSRRSYINHPSNHTSHHRVLNSGAPNSTSSHRADSLASSFTTAIPFPRSSLHPNERATSTTADPPTHAFPLLPPQRWDHNVPPFLGLLVDRKDDDTLGLSSPVPADTIPTGAMEPLSMNPLPSFSTSMDSSLLGSHHGNQHQMQQAHRPSILPNNLTEGRRRYQLSYHMSSIEDLSHSRVVSSDTSDLSFNREDSSHTGG